MGRGGFTVNRKLQPIQYNMGLHCQAFSSTQSFALHPIQIRSLGKSKIDRPFRPLSMHFSTITFGLVFFIRVFSYPQLRRDAYCTAEKGAPCDPSTEHDCCTNDGELMQCNDYEGDGVYWSIQICPGDDTCNVDDHDKSSCGPGPGN
jgi:hypothetical protein